MSTGQRPLDGVRVLDIATVLAAPFCATILGEFGADVIKIELPGGETTRRMGTMARPDSSFNWLNEARNKKSMTLDLRRAEGAEIFKALVRTSDIVVENFMPGTLERWGLGPDVLEAVKKDIILVRVSAYGQDGPYRDRPGYARIAHGYAGLAYLAGEPGQRPVTPGSTSLADYITGMYAAIGALLAYISRVRYGVGQSVDLGLYEGILRVLDDLIPSYAATGKIRERLGADAPSFVPHSHYETRDRQWIALACTTDAMWARFARMMGREDLLAPDKYEKAAQRIADRDEVNRITAEYIRSLEREELLARAIAAEVPMGPINNIADIFADPHIAERGNLVTVDAPGVGPVVMAGVLPRLSQTPGAIRSAGPLLGQDTPAILSELGKTADEIAALRRAGVI